MREPDFKPFAAMLDDIGALLQPGAPLGATAKAMYFRALGDYSLEQVRQALDAHVKDPSRGRFFPRPADVVAQLQGLAAEDGRPGPEEAWALVVVARDEGSTVVWTEEMAWAWSIAKHVMDIGDEVGARMTFREAYTRRVDDARMQRLPVTWTASLGHDPEQRRHAVVAAVEAGRLPKTELLELPAPKADPAALLPAPEGMSVVGAAIRQGLREFVERMRRQPDEVIVDTSERDALNAAKRAADLRAREYAASQGINLDGSPLGGQQEDAA